VSELLHGLNREQQEAVKIKDGPALILAGAGSGKTRVLTRRIAYLVSLGVSPSDILAITFTNKAAGEMKDRVAELLDTDISRMWVSTFHSACHRILRRDIDKLGYNRSFAIADTTDQKALVKRCLDEFNLDDKKYTPAMVSGKISNIKNSLQSPEEYAKRAGDFFSVRMVDIYYAYQKKLKENNAVDFDDLLLLTVQLFREHPDVLKYYQEKFKYIMVDEYQDTNHVQYVLIKLLSARYENLFVVGDSDQSIFGWRGADLTNILNFEEDFPEAVVVKLERNYRSTGNILSAAHQVISNNVYRKEKKLWTEEGPGEKISLVRLNTGEEEARFLAEEIGRLRRDGYAYGDVAVLYRTHAQSRALEDALMSRGIPYGLVGGVKFYERKEIKDILAYLNLIINPENMISFQRVINVPARGIGERSIARLEIFAKRHNLSAFAALGHVDEIDGLTAKQKQGMKSFYELIRSWQALDEGLFVLVQRVMEESGYLAYLQEQANREAADRLENLQEFLSVVREYLESGQVDDLETFLAEISLTTDLDTWSAEESKVTLMTLHSAKGLEFPVVFLTGMEEGTFPHSRSLENDNELEEERRLCYVGITRAEKKLYLSYVDTRKVYGVDQMRLPSRFLDELPEEVIVSSGKVMGVKPFKGEFFAGDRVIHPKWGNGTIVSTRGSGDNLELSIAFNSLGIKQVLAKYAKLAKV